MAVETTYLLSDDRLTIYLADSAGEYKQYDASMLMSAKDLRQAARVFNDLAEALESKDWEQRTREARLGAARLLFCDKS